MNLIEDQYHSHHQCIHYGKNKTCRHPYCQNVNLHEPNRVCPYFVQTYNPRHVTFQNRNQLEKFLSAWFFRKDFRRDFTRKQLKSMLDILYPHVSKGNPRSFSHMCKDRMVKHIEFHIKLHRLNCRH